ncbi:substrate-binding periplasmic protein [Bdellovibrio sp. HCB185ZH]|uniref:substrate-binding periplasmic protein n=1 Tax=Bdellovibrio sp. HCB185ZH TaxID=3394235 RepID=UPI0039A5E867
MSMIFFGAFLSLFLLAQPTMALPCQGSYRVAVNESEPLYFQEENSKKFTGVSFDTVEELAKRTTCKFTAVPLNRSRLLSEIKSYRIDLVVVTIKNPVFDEYAQFIPIQKVQREALLINKENHKTFRDVLNDPKIHFIILPAAAYFFTTAEVETLTKADRFKTAPSLQAAYQLLNRTPHAAVVQNEFVHEYFKKTVPLSQNYTRIPDTESSFEIGIYNRTKDRSKDLEAISQAIQEMVKDGTWERITKSYTNYKKPASRLK